MGLSVFARRAAVIASSITMLGSLLTLPGQAAAAHVECGDVLTESTTLDSDLLSCPGNGVEIGASDIILNLAGHTIDGQPTRDETSAVAGDADRVRIVDGTLRGFDGGISLTTSDSVIRGVTAHGTFGGITLEGDSNRVQGTDAFGQIASIGVYGDGNEILRNRSVGDILHAGPYSEFAIALSGQGNVVTGNRISGARNSIRLFYGDDTLISRNVLSDGVFGILAGGDGTRITRNLVVDHGGSTGYGFGISVDETATRAEVERNTANRNGTGIIVASPDTVVTRNIANFNAELGIDAVPGTVDGGGNRARGNGNPAQCVNIDCR